MKRPSFALRRTAGRSPVAAALAVLSLVGCGDGGVASRPVPLVADPLLPVQRDLNVVVVSFDALRPDVLGAYGDSRGATPNMDRFAEEGFVFTNAYSVAPVTPTSFAAAWSGFLPTRVFLGWRLRAPATLAGKLSEAGYRTQAFINNVQLAPERGFALGFDGYDWRRNDPDEEVLEEAEAWLGENGDRPFLLWIHFLAPHAPYRERPGAEHLYRTPPTGRFARTSGHDFDVANPAELERIRDLYVGEVWRADQMFGELIERLRELGLLDSTIVVLASDHGEEFAEHGGFQHGRLYEEHLRIPLIVRHPAGSGRQVEERVRNVDLLPTLLHAVGRPTDDRLDGVVVRAPSSQPPQPVVGLSMTGGPDQGASLLAGSRKLIVTCGPEGGAELYDLASDPGEQRDLAPTDPRGLRDLARTLGTLLGGDPCTVVARAAEGRAPTTGLDDESVEALRALGYLD